ncbi:MAG: [Fe-Fe] hydrogenase large subunit C-terminal domain-containing protein, partial [Acetivibrio sp.]
CDVKAIAVKNEQAQIINELCILCGHCLSACPQNAKSIISDLDKVKNFIQSGVKTVISVAPSYAGVLEFEKRGQIVTGLLKLGFSQVRETSEGAAYVTDAYKKLIEKGTMDNIISTCCPSVNDLIEIYYPESVPYMAPVVSPMIAHGKMIKDLYGQNTKVVFLGPCIAKKREAENDPRTNGIVDAVLNFSEVKKWMKEENINLSQLECTEFHNSNPRVNRLYPVGDGVITSIISSERSADKYRKIAVDGTKSCMELLDSMKKGEIHNAFIEMNICEGGCVRGPALDKQEEYPSTFKIKLDMEEAIPKEEVRGEEYKPLERISIGKVFCDRSVKEIIPSEQRIRETLSKIGKTEKAHELNCGACGYATCREKAIAVCQGKAELTMCIPYMHEKAQSMSNIVLDTTPNVILLVDAEMRIIEFSRGAEKVFGKSKTEAIGMYLFEFIDHRDFEEVLTSQGKIMGKRVTYSEYDITTLQSIVYVREINGVLGIFQDISSEAEKSKQAYKMKMDTIEMAQRVIDKQMMVAQEIAGLLGETTAETKVTLTKLRDTIINDGE